MKPLSTPYQLLLIIAIVLAVFYPSLFAEVCLIDDVQAITAILNIENFSLADIIIPRSLGGGYYRPFIGLSYWLDKRLWFLQGGLMHFEIVVAHLLNVVLVFLITREAGEPNTRKRDGYLPMVAALLFALHPIVTESVNWISGRTDIMMGNFVLLSFLLLLKYKRQGSTFLLWLSLLCAGCALLAKEAAFGYLIAIPLFLATGPDCFQATGPRGRDPKYFWYLFLGCYTAAFFSALSINNFWLVLAIAGLYLVILLKTSAVVTDSLAELRKRFWLIIAALVVSLGSFYMVRRIAYASDVDKIGQTVKLMFADLNYSISLFLGAVGFYVKKFFVPLPLNFFIIEIDPLYDFVGIAILLIVINLLVVRSFPALLGLAGIFLLLPALPFAFGTIAWTAYAERYIYLSSAFWSIALCLWISHLLRDANSTWKNATTLAVAAVIVGVGVTTYARNTVWQTNVALLKNTVDQNQNNRMLRDVYMAALINAGNIEEAKRQYRIAATLPATYYKNSYDDRADLIMGGQLSKEGNSREALRVYQDAIVKSKGGSEALLVAAIQTIKTMAGTTGDHAERMRLEALQQVYTIRLKGITQNAHLLLEFGKDAMRGGSFDEAVQLFDKALTNLPHNDRLRPTVEHLRNDTRKM